MPFLKANPMESLRTLMGLKSVTNVGGLTDRGLDIAQGLGDYEPDETELLAAQNELGGTVSREALRKGAMAHIKRRLADASTAQSYKLQQEGAQTHRDLSKQRLANEGTENVARINAEGKAAQAEAGFNAKQAALDALLQGVGNSGRSISVPGVGSVGREPVAAGGGRMQQPTDQQMKRLNSARGNFEGFSPFSSLYEKFTGKPSGERIAYGTELEGILDRTGNLGDMNDMLGMLAQYPGSLQDKMAAAQADEAFDYDLSQLGPYEREYLKFKLGQ
jgi:hypothetical protein